MKLNLIVLLVFTCLPLSALQAAIAPPTTVNGVATSANEISWSWSAAPSAVKYNVYINDQYKTTVHSNSYQQSDLGSGTYRLYITSIDGKGNISEKSGSTSVTLPGSVEPPNGSVIINSSNITRLSETSITIQWSVNVKSQAHIEYGRTTSYGSTSRKETSYTYSTHTQFLNNLQPGTLYHYRLHASDAFGNVAATEDKTFSTPGSAGPDPDGEDLFFGSFNTNEGALNSSSFASIWGLRWKTLPSNGQLVSGASDAYQGRALKVRYPARTLGKNQRVAFASDFKKLGVGYRTSAYLRYYVKFHPGFEFVKGGKLPGLAGGEAITGGNPANGSNGWSTRFMWRQNGTPVVYGYLPGKYAAPYGYDFKLKNQNSGQEDRLPVGEWICLEQFVQLNDVGQANGKIKAWLNGDLGVNVSDATFRTTNNDATKVGQMLFSTFYGGNTDDWAPSKDTHASFDNFIISDKRIGCN